MYVFQKSPKDTQLADLFNDQRSAFTQRRKPFKRPFRCARKVVVVFSRVGGRAAVIIAVVIINETLLSEEFYRKNGHLRVVAGVVFIFREIQRRRIRS